jgi:hypothetical protein
MDALARAHRRCARSTSKKNAGQSAWLRRGFRLARGPIVVTLDADSAERSGGHPRARGEARELGRRRRRGDPRGAARLGRPEGLLEGRHTGAQHADEGPFTTPAAPSRSIARTRSCAARCTAACTGSFRRLIRTEGYEVLEMPMRRRERRHGSRSTASRTGRCPGSRTPRRAVDARPHGPLRSAAMKTATAQVRPRMAPGQRAPARQGAPR